jgi:tryptophan synthase alpha chain
LATTSSNPLDAAFDALRRQDRRALVVYVTAGFPTIEASRELLAALPSAGADVIEVGVPFSDPLADGPTIQASSQRALENGMSLAGALELTAAAAPSVPTVLFTYLNPLLSAGETVLASIADAGVSGLLVTDLPLGADPERERWISDSRLAFVRLVAPTTPPERVAQITRYGSGFVYAISRLGVTGARPALSSSVRDTVERIRAVTTLPVCVGFGVATPDHARKLGSVADGVVVGSAIVEAAALGLDAALSLTRTLREALDG